MALARGQNAHSFLPQDFQDKFSLNLKSSLLFISLFASLVFYMFHQGYFDGLYRSICNTFLHHCSFCKEDGHCIAFCPEKSIFEGAYGRWVIPDAGIDVACYLPVDSEDAQDITDARDSAALFSKKDTTYIADHNYQGFNAINKCEIGTVAYMITDAGVKEYVCTNIVEGYNTGDSLTTFDGDIFDFYVDGGYTNYTCNYFKDSVTVVQFAPAI